MTSSKRLTRSLLVAGMVAAFTVSIFSLQVNAQWKKGATKATFRIDENAGLVSAPTFQIKERPVKPTFYGKGIVNSEAIKMTQDFEGTFPPTGWTNSGSWIKGAASGYGIGSGAAEFPFYSVSSGSFTLTSVAFSASVTGDSIKFDHAWANYSTPSSDSIVIFASPNGTDFEEIGRYCDTDPVGTGLVTAAPSGSAFTPTAGQWGTKKLALPVGTTVIRFKAVSDYGNNFYADNIQIGEPPANDIAAFSFDDPANGGSVPPVSAFTPTASFKNWGSAAQTAVSVHYKIYNDVMTEVYTSTKSIATIASGATEQVTFDAVTGGLTSGAYTTKLISALAGDEDLTNDTLNGTLTVTPPMSGTYTIGGTTPDYATFTAAIADVVLRGVSGAVTFNVRSGNYGFDAGTEADTAIQIDPISGVSATNTVTFVEESGTVNILTNNNNPVVFNGCDYVTFDGINVVQTAGYHNLYIGFLIANASATDGAQYNTIKNFVVDLDDTTSGNQTQGVLLYHPITPASAAGVCSYNKFYNFNISGGSWGITLIGGSATYKSIGNEIGVDGPTVSMITANAGTGAGFNTGIYYGLQDQFKIFGTDIQVTQVGAVSLYGITANGTGYDNGTVDVYGNTLHGFIHRSTSSGNIRALHTVVTGTYNFYGNVLYDMTHFTTSTAYVAGISPEAFAVHNIYNNMVSGLYCPGGTSTGGNSNIQGIRANGNAGGTVNAYFNTVYLDAPNTSASRNSACLFVLSGPTTVDYRNNIFINKSASGSGTAARQSAIIKTSTTYTNMALTSNNNLLWAGDGPFTGKRSFFYDGTNTDTTLEAYKTRLSPRDGLAVQEDVDFVNVAALPYDLHIDAATATRIEGAAQPIGMVTTDFDSELRDVSSPDIGADEGAFTLLDIDGPGISYTALPNSPANGQQVLSVTLSDASPLLTTGTGLPVLYYKINDAGTYSPVTGVYVPGEAYIGNYTFTFTPTTVTGDTVFYYVAAQDTLNNVSVYPSAGASGLTANPPAAAVPPTSPSSYRIVPTLSGTFTVGTTTGTFPTLKAAFDSINNVMVTGPVVLEILAEGTSESATASLNGVVYGTGGPFTITVKPAASATPVIEGTITGAIVKLNGADNVIIDGSNTVGGVTRDLTIRNLSTLGSTAAIWLSNPASNPATYNTVKNVNIACGADQSTGTNTTFGIIVSGSSISSSNSGVNNDYNTFENNYITKVRYGIWVRGDATGLADHTAISNNLIGPSDFGSDEIGKVGIGVQYVDATTIWYNTVRYVGGTYALTSSGTDRVGIGLGSDSWTPSAITVNNSIVSGNTIHHVWEQRTFSAVGINLAATNTSTTNNLIANNFVYAILANGTTGDQTVGIGLAYGNGDKVVFNTVSLTDTLEKNPSATTSNQSAVGIRISGANLTNPVIANNIVYGQVYSRTTTLKHYAIVAPAAYSFGTGYANYNNYFADAAVDTQMVLGGIGAAVPYTNVTTIEDWRTQFTPNQELNTSAASVEFVAADDLHLAGASRNSAYMRGTPIAEVTTDFDGDTRDLTNPYKGADESSTFVENPIADFVADQDFADTVIAYLPDIFGFTEPFTVSTVNGVVNAVISGDTLYLMSIPASAGTDVVTVVAHVQGLTETDLFTIEDAFDVTVNSTSNTPPSAFSLLEPADETLITVDETSTDDVIALWTASIDPEAQPVNYTFWASLNPDFSDSVEVFTGTDTTTQLAYIWIDAVLDAWGVADGDTGHIYWKVVATDGVNEVSSTETFLLHAYRWVFEPTVGWAMQTSGTVEDLYSVKAVSQTVAWAAGAAGTVLRTVNGGTTWEDASGGLSAANDIYHVFANDENTAYVIADPAAGGYIYKTTDGGANWYQVFFQSGGFLNAVYVDGMNGVGVGDPVGVTWTVINTTDGGESWFRIATEPTAVSGHYGYNNAMQIHGNNIWFGTNGSRIYHSTDAGATWSFTATSFVSSYDLQFNDATNGIIAGTGIQRTLDGGTTLTAVTVPGSGNFGAIGGAGLVDYWAGRNTTIYHTRTTGDTWTSEFTAPAGIYAMDFTTYDDGGITYTSGWTTTSGGSIVAFFDTTCTVDVKEPTAIPTSYALYQNYPNPFNPTTTIKYDLKENAKVTLKIYNALGQEVRTLVNTKQNAGAYALNWDGRNNAGMQVSSGVYIYRIQAGNFVKSHKMMLLK